MSRLNSNRTPILPNPPKWRPNPDPANIEVPGLDTDASVNDQIEQIEQLITLKLQNIDQNFSKIHHVLTNKILPSLKQFSVSTEPVREAAQFWTSFYEQAAQIRIPTADDYSTVNELPSERTEDTEQGNEPTIQGPAPDSPDSVAGGEHSIAPSESSFAPGNAISSTPATARNARSHDSIMSDSSESQGSWSASVESPLVRLDRDIQRLSEENDESRSVMPETPSRPQAPLPSRDTKGKGREQPLLRSILKPPRYNDSSMTTPSFHSSPAKRVGKIKTPIPKDRNPFLPGSTTPANWTGLVDLRDPSILSPRRMRSPKHPTPRQKSPQKDLSDDDDDDWEGGLPPGMSPPCFMSPARPPRKSAELGLLKLGQTPGKEAVARIARDLVNDFQRRPHNFSTTAVESSMSTVPTPPSLSRYGHKDNSESATIDTSLENEMARMQTQWASSSAEPAKPVQQEEETVRRAPISQGAYPFTTPGQLVEEFGLEDDSFDDDVVNNTAYPSAAFLMASARNANRSFDSEDSTEDSLYAEDAALNAEGGLPIHPFDRVGDFADDSFDDSFDGMGGNEMGTETLFGIPRGQGGGGQTNPDGTGDAADLRLHGHNVFEDTMGMSSQMGHTIDSPTPAYPRGSR